jgi:ubiquitin C-terminal hydrolase
VFSFCIKYFEELKNKYTKMSENQLLDLQLNLNQFSKSTQEWLKSYQTKPEDKSFKNMRNIHQITSELLVVGRRLDIPEINFLIPGISVNTWCWEYICAKLIDEQTPKFMMIRAIRLILDEICSSRHLPTEIQLLLKIADQNINLKNTNLEVDDSAIKQFQKLQEFDNFRLKELWSFKISVFLIHLKRLKHLATLQTIINDHTDLDRSNFLKLRQYFKDQSLYTLQRVMCWSSSVKRMVRFVRNTNVNLNQKLHHLRKKPKNELLEYFAGLDLKTLFKYLKERKKKDIKIFARTLDFVKQQTSEKLPSLSPWVSNLITQNAWGISHTSKNDILRLERYFKRKGAPIIQHQKIDYALPEYSTNEEYPPYKEYTSEYYQDNSPETEQKPEFLTKEQQEERIKQWKIYIENTSADTSADFNVAFENCGNSCFYSAANLMLFQMSDIQEYLINNINSETHKDQDRYKILFAFLTLYMFARKNENKTISCDTFLSIIQGQRTVRQIFNYITQGVNVAGNQDDSQSYLNNMRDKIHEETPINENLISKSTKEELYDGDFISVFASNENNSSIHQLEIKPHNKLWKKIEEFYNDQGEIKYKISDFIITNKEEIKLNTDNIPDNIIKYDKFDPEVDDRNTTKLTKYNALSNWADPKVETKNESSFDVILPIPQQKEQKDLLVYIFNILQNKQPSYRSVIRPETSPFPIMQKIINKTRYTRKYLTVQLQLYDATNKKINNQYTIQNEHITFTYNNDDLSVEPASKKIKYNLVSIIIKTGAINSGHYYIFKKTKDIWYNINDSIITEIPNIATAVKSLPKTHDPYLLLFQKEDKND